MKKSQHLTKESLLNEASLQFSQHGFSEASVRSICKEVGVSVAAINYHFGNKNNLVTTVVENSVNKFAQALDESLNENHCELKDFLYSYGMKLFNHKKELLITFRNMFTSSVDEGEFSSLIIKVMEKFFNNSRIVAERKSDIDFSEEDLKNRVDIFNSVIALEIVRRNLMPSAAEYTPYENWLRYQIDFIFRK